MTRSPTEIVAIALSGIRRNRTVLASCLAFVLTPAVLAWSAEDRQQGDPQHDLTGKACKVLAGKRLEKPLRTIVDEYSRRSKLRFTLDFRAASEVNALVEKKQTGCDVVLCMPADVKSKTAVGSLPRAKTVAWKHPSGEPVWAAVLTKHPEAAGLF